MLSLVDILAFMEMYKVLQLEPPLSMTMPVVSTAP